MAAMLQQLHFHAAEPGLACTCDSHELRRLFLHHEL
jgi:hypothetical protein